jgi:hypothetical protein
VLAELFGPVAVCCLLRDRDRGPEKPTRSRAGKTDKTAGRKDGEAREHKDKLEACPTWYGTVPGLIRA